MARKRKAGQCGWRLGRAGRQWRCGRARAQSGRHVGL